MLYIFPSYQKNRATKEVFMRRIVLVVVGLFLVTATLVGCASVDVGAEGGGRRTYHSPR